MSVRNYEHRSRKLTMCLILPVIAIMLILGLLFRGFELLIPVGIPIMIIIAVIVILIKLSWNPQHYCSRCQHPVSIYAEFCRNCGLKLIRRCPNCDKHVREGLSRCPTCGYVLKSGESQIKSDDYKRIEKGAKLPSKPNFCPTCGASLKNAENVRFCEFCGSRIR